MILSCSSLLSNSSLPSLWSSGAVMLLLLLLRSPTNVDARRSSTEQAFAVLPKTMNGEDFRVSAEHFRKWSRVSCAACSSFTCTFMIPPGMSKTIANTCTAMPRCAISMLSLTGEGLMVLLIFLRSAAIR